jgi:hypothetical protein
MRQRWSLFEKHLLGIGRVRTVTPPVDRKAILPNGRWFTRRFRVMISCAVAPAPILNGPVFATAILLASLEASANPASTVLERWVEGSR